MTLRPATIRLIALAIAALLAIGGAIHLTTPLRPRPVDAPATAFSAGRAMRDVAAIARAPHPTGTRAHAQARAYIIARLHALGLETSVQKSSLAGKPAKRLAGWSRQDVSRVTLANIVAIWPGRDRAAPALVLMAHYDTVWGSPGAADDTAGVATVLEDVRAMQAAGIRPQRDIVLLFTDGEELGLAGAHAFFERPGVAARIGMVVNHETRGGGGRTAMFETGLGNGAAMRLFARVVPHPMVTSLSVLVYRLMPNSTDLTVAIKQRLPGYNFAFIGRPSLYHSPLATPAAIEPGAIQDMGDQSLALVRELATIPKLPTRGGDAVFGDLLGLTTVAYPPIAGWVALALAAVLLAFAIVRLRREAKLVSGDLRPGIVVAAFTVALAAPLLVLGNALSTGWAKPEYYDRLAAIHRLEAQAAILCLAAILIGLVAARTRPRWAGALAMISLGAIAALLGGSALLVLFALPAAVLAMFLPRTTPPLQPTLPFVLSEVEGRAAEARTSTSLSANGDGRLIESNKVIHLWSTWLGATLLLLIVALAVQIAAPLAAGLFAWPALLAAVSIALQAWRDRPGTLVLLAIPSGLGLAQLLTLAHFTFSGIGAPLPIVMLVFVIGALPLSSPLLANLPRGRPLGLAILTLVIAAMAIALWVRLDPVAPSVPTYLGR